MDHSSVSGPEFATNGPWYVWLLSAAIISFFEVAFSLGKLRKVPDLLVDDARTKVVVRRDVFEGRPLLNWVESMIVSFLNHQGFNLKILYQNKVFRIDEVHDDKILRRTLNSWFYFSGLRPWKTNHRWINFIYVLWAQIVLWTPNILFRWEQICLLREHPTCSWSLTGHSVEYRFC